MATPTFTTGRVDLDVGWHGSDQGDAYARAFLDYLANIRDNARLERHLDANYTLKHRGDSCLNYQSGKFTRLPNRYYTFHYGGIDFFCPDSNPLISLLVSLTPQQEKFKEPNFKLVKENLMLASKTYRKIGQT